MQWKLLCIENMATWRSVNCRFLGQITRPALANERLSVNRAGQVVLKLKTAYRDGTSHIVMTPLEFTCLPAGRCNGSPPWCRARACI